MAKKGFGSRERAEEAAQKMNEITHSDDYYVKGYTDPVNGKHRDDVVARKPRKRK